MGLTYGEKQPQTLPITETLDIRLFGELSGSGHDARQPPQRVAAVGVLDIVFRAMGAGRR
jgi:hypothetical protein